MDPVVFEPGSIERLISSSVATEIGAGCRFLLIKYGARFYDSVTHTI